MYSSRRKSGLVVLAVLALSAMSFTPGLLSLVQPLQATTTSFSFATAGDLGYLNFGDGQASLGRLSTSGASFFLALGDLSYDSAVTGDVWCSQFKSQFSNVEVVPGNHDTGEVNGTTGTRSYEKFVNGCPFTLTSPISCGPVTGNCYGKEYFFDYPSTSPLARFITISPRVFNITGICTVICSSAVGDSCTDQYGCWQYNAGDAHYNWLSSAIDNARASSIKWVIVASHKDCIAAGDQNCSYEPPLFNLLVGKKVDLIIYGHDHSYQRSKQLGLNTSTCTGFTDSNGFTVYNSACIVDDGSRGFYSAGAGTVVMIQGTFGAGLNNVNDTTVNGGANAAEAPYFAKLMGANTPGNGHGFVKYTFSSSSITMQTNFAGTFSDIFSITTSPLASSFTYSPASPKAGQTVTFNATASGGTSPYTFSWNFGDSTTSSGSTTTHSYANPGIYNVTLTATDSTGQTSQALHAITVTSAPLAATFSYNPSSPTAGQTVTFTATASGGSSPYTFNWNLGDGTTVSGNPVTHSYTAGTYNVQLTVLDSAGASSTVTNSITVKASTSDFSITANPSGLSVLVGASGTSTITLASLGTFSGNITLSTSVSPAGPIASLNPITVIVKSGGTATSTLTVPVSSGTMLGNYTVLVTGTAGATSHSTTLSIRFVDYNLLASPSSLTIVQGGSNSSLLTLTSLNGFSGPVSLAASSSYGGLKASLSPTTVTLSSGGSGSSTLRLSTIKKAKPGIYNVTVTVSVGTVSRTLILAVQII